MDALTLAENYINGNKIFVKHRVKKLPKREFLQLVWRLQDLGINDQEIEWLVN